MQMLNYSKRLSMRREIQNPLMFETDPGPESFSPAKHFIWIVYRTPIHGTRPEN
jgi:hypothetical protein